MRSRLAVKGERVEFEILSTRLILEELSRHKLSRSTRELTEAHLSLQSNWSLRIWTLAS